MATVLYGSQYRKNRQLRRYIDEPVGLVALKKKKGKISTLKEKGYSRKDFPEVGGSSRRKLAFAKMT